MRAPHLVASVAVGSALLFGGDVAAQQTEEVVSLGPEPGDQWTRHCPPDKRHDIRTGRCVGDGEGEEEEEAPPPGQARRSSVNFKTVAGGTLIVLGVAGGVLSVIGFAAHADELDGLGVAGLVVAASTLAIGVPLLIIGLSGSDRARATPPPSTMVAVGAGSVWLTGRF